jgi:hypothetical protein
LIPRTRNQEALVLALQDPGQHIVVTAGPAGVGIKSNTSPEGMPQVDINNLDMRNPEHRKIYAQYRKAKGISY